MSLYRAGLWRLIRSQHPRTRDSRGRCSIRDRIWRAPREHARRSVKIDPKLAEGHARARTLSSDGQFRRGAARGVRTRTRTESQRCGSAPRLRRVPGPAASERDRSARTICGRAATSIRLSPIQGCGSRDGVRARRSGRAKVTHSRRHSRNVSRPPPAASCSPDVGKSSRRTGSRNRLGDRGAAPGSNECGRVTRHRGVVGATWNGCGIKQVLPESSLRILFWQRRYDEILERMSKADLDERECGFARLPRVCAAGNRHTTTEAIQILKTWDLPKVAMDEELRRIGFMHHFSILIGSMNATGDTAQARKLALLDGGIPTTGNRERSWLGGPLVVRVRARRPGQTRRSIARRSRRWPQDPPSPGCLT